MPPSENLNEPLKLHSYLKVATKQKYEFIYFKKSET